MKRGEKRGILKVVRKPNRLKSFQYTVSIFIYLCFFPVYFVFNVEYRSNIPVERLRFWDFGASVGFLLFHSRLSLLLQIVYVAFVKQSPQMVYRKEKQRIRCLVDERLAPTPISIRESLINCMGADINS